MIDSIKAHLTLTMELASTYKAVSHCASGGKTKTINKRCGKQPESEPGETVTTSNDETAKETMLTEMRAW